MEGCTMGETSAMTSIHDILEELRSQAYDEHDKGVRFEKLMQAYLRVEPQYADLYDEVWLWMEYPRRDGRKDTGIDLVARTRATGEYTAIQCKFYAPTTTVTKPMLDSFLSASSKNYDDAPEFTARMVISTSDTWGKNAEEAVEQQNPPVARLRVGDLDESSIDWSQFSLAKPGELVKKVHKKPFPHQETAISKVLGGLDSADRGKLIMACGTGKTYTSLQIVERQVPKGGTVLFLVPSIALLSQTLKEWTIEASIPLRSFAVCSDVSVGKRKDEEDTAVVDLAYPATTNTARLVQKFSQVPEDPDTVTVIFSTYQSIEVVAAAQEAGIPEFDLIVCDEAHRTTGVTLSDGKISPFVRVHDQSYIQGKKRLYMTATPRIYSDTAISKAEEAGAAAIDMNQPEFGEEFHRLSFGEAVSIGRLTDYKVLVLAVDESYVSKRFQRLLADEHNELTLDDAAKIVGCWNGLSKRALTADEFSLDPLPMKRAVAFARNIKESQKIANLFEQVVTAEIEAIDRETDESAKNLLEVQVHHVDGTFNVLKRNEELDWLKQDPGQDNARILTNARCLSEGVDVPALDAVMFLNPRDSVVDVVQSVGRVMRKLEGKNYGYVILPIGVPAGVDPSVALNDNKKYKVVWQVLQALRAHDERFDAEVNKIDLTKKTDKLQVGVIGKGGNSQDREGGEADYGSVTLEMPEIDVWRDAILAKIVDKVGERRYWESWAKDVAGIASTHITRITTLVDGSDSILKDEFARFMKGLQDNLNPYITQRDAIEMLSQHLITKPVFDALFNDYAFSESNPVSQVMQGMVDALEGQNLDKETETLERFYESVRLRAADIDDGAAKQSIVKELYERFFKTAFSGTSDRLGIVYTPNEIVDFIVHSVDDALRTEFDASLTDEGIHVLDPFTGTGTFIVRLLQSGLIKPEDLARKYRYELHANELVLLAYYVAAINIEETFHALEKGDYEPFDGIVLTDTFQMTESDDKDELAGFEVFAKNNERVEAQKKLDIRVVIGNPPWSKGKDADNEEAGNLSYPTLDSRISKTYAAASTAQLKSNLYNSYIRAIRWASDRVGDKGIVAFVSSGGFIDGVAAAGVRRCLQEEFDSVYVMNLRGNQRSADWKKEGGKVFGEGSQNTVAIYLLIRGGSSGKSGVVHYAETADEATREQKLAQLAEAKTFMGIDWREIAPNEAGDWINQRSPVFETFPAVASDEGPMLTEYGHGLKSNRDGWVYNFSRSALAANIKTTIDTFDAELASWPKDRPVGDPVQNAATKISWSAALRARLKRRLPLTYDPDSVVPGLYGPFCTQHLYFNKALNERQSLLARVKPDAEFGFGLYLVPPAATKPFAVLAVRDVPTFSLWGSEGGVLLPRYLKQAEAPANGFDIWQDNSSEGRVDNVTDETLASYQATYGSEVTKNDIFFYMYGILHSPEYRTLFKADLKKTLPRIPLVSSFTQFRDAGHKLMALHLDFEKAEPYPLVETRTANATNEVKKMRYSKVGKLTDRTSLVYNSGVVLSGIPEQAQDYILGPRSAIDWLIERYQFKADKDTGITNDPNQWFAEQGNDRWLIDLIQRVVTVSVETMGIVKTLPALDVLIS